MSHLAVNTTYGTRFPIKVCDIEYHEETALPTYALMKRLEEKHPETYSYLQGYLIYLCLSFSTKMKLRKYSKNYMNQLGKQVGCLCYKWVDKKLEVLIVSSKTTKS